MEYIYTMPNTNSIKTILDINDWNYYIYRQKIKLINEIDKSNILDSSTDSFKFNSILKNIIKINIFNISYIAFMTLKFLETSFIPSEILLNVINIYSDDKMWELLILNKKNINITDANYKIEIYKYIKKLTLIINCIIEFVIKIEISLTIQCLLITNFIDKINSKNDNNNDDNNNNNDNNDNDDNYNNYNKKYSFKPKIFNLFHKSNIYICKTIKSSTLILLLFKFINKLNNDNYDNEYISVFKLDNNNYNDNDTNILNYINKKKEINKKTNMYLDTFILEITQYFSLDNSIINSNNKNNNNINTNTNTNTIYSHNIHHPDIYIICSKYILNNIELLFNNFENIFTILEAHLLKSININKNKEQKLSYLKNIIKNLADIEIDNIKKLFYVNI